MIEFSSVLSAGIDGDVRLDDISRKLYSTDASIYEIDPVGVVLPSKQSNESSNGSLLHA